MLLLKGPLLLKGIDRFYIVFYAFFCLCSTFQQQGSSDFRTHVSLIYTLYNSGAVLTVLQKYTLTGQDNISVFLCFFFPVQTADAPTPPISSCPSPVLSVQPSDGAVTLGDTLHFRCSVPIHSNQLQSQSSKPAMFLLLREQTGITSVIPLHQASQLSNPEPQPGVFNVGPVRGGEEGQYTCLYQINSKKGLVNSSVSNVVQVTIRGEDFFYYFSNLCLANSQEHLKAEVSKHLTWGQNHGLKSLDIKFEWRRDRNIDKVEAKNSRTK